MSKKKGEKGYHRKDIGNKEWKEIKDYIKENKGRVWNDDEEILKKVFWILKAGSS